MISSELKISLYEITSYGLHTNINMITNKENSHILYKLYTESKINL